MGAAAQTLNLPGGGTTTGGEGSTMGRTFVSTTRGADSPGFWMRDGDLELWLRLLALHIEEPAGPDSVAAAIRNQFLFASRWPIPGCVLHGMADVTAMQEGTKVVRAAIDSLMAALAVAPDRLSKDVFNLMGFSGTFGRDFERRQLTEIGRAFLDLLDGKITSGPEDTSFWPGRD